MRGPEIREASNILLHFWNRNASQLFLKGISNKEAFEARSERFFYRLVTSDFSLNSDVFESLFLLMYPEKFFEISPV